jgi:hypothetical protein
MCPWLLRAGNVIHANSGSRHNPPPFLFVAASHALEHRCTFWRRTAIDVILTSLRQHILSMPIVGMALKVCYCSRLPQIGNLLLNTHGSLRPVHALQVVPGLHMPHADLHTEPRLHNRHHSIATSHWQSAHSRVRRLQEGQSDTRL